MGKRFSEKTASVLIVEPNATARSVLAEAVKWLGFQEVQSMDSVKAALGYFEVECVDWIITPLSASEQVNALHLLEVFARYPHLAHVRMSLLLEEGEQLCLPQAFELGLLSWHKRTFTKDSLKADLTEFIKVFQTHEWNETLTASTFLAQICREQGLAKSLLALYENLYEQYSENPTVLLKLAEAQFLNNKREQGKITLGQAQLLDIAGWQEAAKTHLIEGETPTPDLGVRTCVIVDSDEGVHKTLQELLQKNGATECIAFTDGEAALTWCNTNPPPDLILQEWRIPKLSGPYLIQRVRQRGFQTVPIVILSSLVTKQDSALLSEMTVANVIQKPLDEAIFLKALVYTLQQERHPTLHRTLERKIHQHLMANEKEEAQKLRVKVDLDPAAGDGLKKFLEALFYFYDDRFELARTSVVAALQAHAEQVKAFNLLGRCLVKLRDFEGACKCFKKAQSLSPKNIERLCELASAQAEMGETAAASESLGAAKELDQGNKQITEGEGKIAIQTGDMEKARELLMQLGSLTGLVSDMNNSAVALIRCGQFESGVSLYQRTLDALPQKQLDVRMRVLYNLGLAHARKSQVNEALEILEQVPPSPDFPVQAKIRSLRTKLRKARDEGTDLNLITAADTDQGGIGARSSTQSGLGNSSQNPDSNVGEVSDMELRSNSTTSILVEARAGERCCHLIFRAIEPLDALFQGLLENPPPFKERAAIERQASHGADRLLT